MTSLPVPDSPWMSTVESVGATVSTRRSTSSHALARADRPRAALAFVAPDLLLERLVLDAQLAMLGGAAQDRDQLVVAERLLDVIEGAFVHRLHRRLQRGLRRHEDDRHVRILLPRRGEDLDAADVRHADVGEDDVRDSTRAMLLEPRLAAVRDVRREALVAQQDVERIENARFRRRRRGRWALTRGPRHAKYSWPAAARVGKYDGEARAAARTAVDEDESAVRLDGAMHDGETEPAAVRLSW